MIKIMEDGRVLLSGDELDLVAEMVSAAQKSLLTNYAAGDGSQHELLQFAEEILSVCHQIQMDREP